MLKLLITIDQVGEDNRLRVSMDAADEAQATDLELMFAELLRRLMHETIKQCRGDQPRTGKPN